jgi:hypothetical protein
VSDFEKKASGIFEKFAEKLGGIDRRNAAALVAVVGVGVFFGGIAQEMQGQAHLMHAGGLAAVDAYKDVLQSAQLGLGDWLKSGVLGKLPSFGGDMQARGFLMATAGPALAAVSVSLARGFNGMRESVADVAQKLGIGEQVRDIVAKDTSLKVANDFASGVVETKVLNVQSGRYAGAVLFETDHHVVQDVGRKAAVIHDKAAFNAPELKSAIERGGSLRVQYDNGRAAIDTGKGRAQSHTR